ncbi:MAG: hypothetical protein J5518_05040 [Lachnospiraceae bacterium]|nr:hypothetical protein [Lachnospiraceae bacterium]
MREIISSFFAAYGTAFGRGKLIPLFLVALIVLIAIEKKSRSRVNPLLFVLSVWTGISYAFVRLFERLSKRWEKVFVAVLLLVLVIFSGTLIWMSPIHETGEARAQREAGYREVFETILQADPQAKVIAEPDIMPYFNAYSPDFTPLYEAEDILSVQNPDFEKLGRVCRKEGRFFAVIDKEDTWPEKMYENDFDLMTTIGHYDIYVFSGGAHE